MSDGNSSSLHHCVGKSRAEQECTSPQHTPERPPFKNETVTGPACGCGCSCPRCTCRCNPKTSRDALDIPGRDADIGSHSLTTEMSGLTFGDSMESSVSFDRQMEHHESRFQQMPTIEPYQHNEMNEEEEINFNDVDNDPQSYFLERRQTGDSNEVYMEPFIFEDNRSGSMCVNLSPEDERLMQSYASSLSPSSSGSSALLKDIGAIFGSNSDSESGNDRRL